MKNSIELLQKILNQTDVNGNKFRFNGKDIYYNDRGIGFIAEVDGKIYYRKKEEESQIYKRTNAWSIPALIVPYVDVIQYQTELRGYQVLAKDALEYEIISYNDEPKYYVPVSAWDILVSTLPTEQKRIDTFGVAWYNKLRPIIGTGLLDDIAQWLSSRLADKAIIYPAVKDIFKPYRETPPNEVKVVFIADEPFDDELADGLALSYRLPFGYNQVVENIQKELERTHYKTPHLYNPESWAAQGCLMINQLHTVEKNHLYTHEGHGWEDFTKAVVQSLTNLPTNLVFVLLGTKSFYLRRYITSNHRVFEYNPFDTLIVGSDLFVEIDRFIEQQHKSKIIW